MPVPMRAVFSPLPTHDTPSLCSDMTGLPAPYEWVAGVNTSGRCGWPIAKGKSRSLELARQGTSVIISTAIRLPLESLQINPALAQKNAF